MSDRIVLAFTVGVLLASGAFLLAAEPVLVAQVACVAAGIVIAWAWLAVMSGASLS